MLIIIVVHRVKQVVDVESVMFIPLQIFRRYLECIIVTWKLILIFLHSLDIVYNYFIVYSVFVVTCTYICGGVLIAWNQYRSFCRSVQLN